MMIAMAENEKKVRKLTGEEELCAKLIWTQTQMAELQKENLALRQEILRLRNNLMAVDQARIAEKAGLDLQKVQRGDDGSFSITED